MTTQRRGAERVILKLCVQVNTELSQRSIGLFIQQTDRVTDTTMKVLELRKEINEEKEAGESSRSGIFTTGIVSELQDAHRVVLYFTGRQHAGENIADVLAHRSAELDKPIQMCEALDHNLPKAFGTIVGNCLTHVRRKFVGVVTSFPDECRYVLEIMRDVYVHDATARDRELSDEERLRYHQDHSGPLMNELERWMRSEIDEKRTELLLRCTGPRT